MFENISNSMLSRMRHLEAMDRGEVPAPPPGRLWQVPPESGRFLAILAAGAPPGIFIEIGASGGYSGMWIALALRERCDALNTFEVDPGRAALARETYELSGISDIVTLVEGDAMKTVPEFFAEFEKLTGKSAKASKDPFLALCFLDAEKRDYGYFYDLIVPALVPGGILAADNMISHAGELAEFEAMVMKDARVDSLVVPIGSGILVCRKCG